MKEIIKNNLINYLIQACQEDSVEFLLNKDKNSLISYLKDSEKASGNSYWSHCALEDACTKIIEAITDTNNNIDVRFSTVDEKFFEKIWLKCAEEKEKSYFIDIFAHNIHHSGSPFSNLNNLTNNDYINEVISHFLNNYKNYLRSNYSDDAFTNILALSLNKKYFKITKENLKLVCDNTYHLKDIKYQQILKTFVEKNFPNDINSFQSYWYKIDEDLVKDKEPVTQHQCIYIAFNKIYIYNLIKDKDMDFYERKLKSISVFLNKKKYTKINRY